MDKDLINLKLQEELKNNEILKLKESRDNLIAGSIFSIILFVLSISLLNIEFFSKNKHITKFGEACLIEVNEMSRFANNLNFNINGEQLLNLISVLTLASSATLASFASKKTKDLDYLKKDKELIYVSGLKLYGDKYKDLVLIKEEKKKTKKAIK